MQQLGKYLVFGALILLVIGLILYFFGNKLGWLGHLPGDIRIERQNFRFYFPITTMILLSVLLSIVIRIIQRFF